MRFPAGGGERIQDVLPEGAEFTKVKGEQVKDSAVALGADGKTKVLTVTWWSRCMMGMGCR